MAIFGIIESEPTVQVNDKTRIKAGQSFVSKDEAAVTLVEIEPEAGGGFVDVTGSSSDDWFLDWSYATDGTKAVSLRITTDGAPVTVTKDIEVVTEANDNLFSSDSALTRYENEVLDLLPDGYSSFNYMHRKVKELILDWFNEEGYRTWGGDKITDAEIVDKEEVRKWAENWVLSLIYHDNSNSVEDKFMDKHRFYDTRARDARTRSVFELDLNKDGEITDGEKVRVQSLRLNRQ